MSHKIDQINSTVNSRHERLTVITPTPIQKETARRWGKRRAAGCSRCGARAAGQPYLRAVETLVKVVFSPLPRP